MLREKDFNLEFNLVPWELYFKTNNLIYFHINKNRESLPPANPPLKYILKNVIQVEVNCSFLFLKYRKTKEVLKYKNEK